MSFYIHKSLRAGPFRFNLSKSGVGVSAGFKGFRIGTSPRGNCVHMGRNGLYYRTTFPRSNKPASQIPAELKPDFPSSPLNAQVSTVEMKEIESVDVLQLHDSSSADLLAEMNSKHKKLQICPIVTALSVVGLIVLSILNVQAWVYAIAIPIVAIAIFLAHRHDQIVKTVILFYELDSHAENAFQALHDAFKELLTCTQAWHIASSGKVTDLYEQKRQAGANSLVQRNAIHFSIQAPPYVSTNLSIPAIPVGRQRLFFFPDRLLVYENGKVGAVSYSEIQLELGNKRFIESQAVPRDTQIIGETWQYVNKKGGPDRRFKDNRQLPIVLYSELYFKSSSGLNELIQVSRPDTGTALVDAFTKLISAQKGVSGSIA